MDEVQEPVSLPAWRRWSARLIGALYWLFITEHALGRPIGRLIAARGREGFGEFLAMLGTLAFLFLASRILEFMFGRLQARSQRLVVWALAAGCIAISATIDLGPPIWLDLVRHWLDGLPGFIPTLASLVVLGLLAYGVLFALSQLTGWPRNLTCMGLLTAMWGVGWSAIVLATGGAQTQELGSDLLIVGPVLITWMVALAYWRIDVSSRKPSGATVS